MQNLKNKEQLQLFLKDQIFDADEQFCKNMLYKTLLNNISKNKLLTLNILHYLKTNAKLSDREIAKKLNTSQSTITRHRHLLEKKEIIKNYTAIMNITKLIEWIFD